MMLSIVYKRAQAINPSYAEAYYNLGVAYAKQAQWDKAIDEYRKALLSTHNTPMRIIIWRLLI